jgi:hypothetical protein
MQPSLESVLTLLDCISEDFRELRESVRKAVQSAEVDPEMALARTRKVLEYIARDVYEKRCKEPPGTRPLENLLQRLVKDGHWPARLEAYATAIRLLGNVGTHRFGEAVSVADVYLALVQMIPILEWYFGIESTPAPRLAGSPSTMPLEGSPEIVYDNQSADPSFQTWGLYSTGRRFSETIRLVPQGDPDVSVADPRLFTTKHLKSVPVALLLQSDGTEQIGVNKALPYLSGEAVFEYQALESASSSLNLLFCVIPMQRDGPDGENLIEVGAQHCDEPENAYSPHRRRWFVPREHVGDGVWHQTRIEFDFRAVPTTAYTILAPRINEGCPRPSSGKLLVRNAQLFMTSEKEKK